MSVLSSPLFRQPVLSRSHPLGTLGTNSVHPGPAPKFFHPSSVEEQPASSRAVEAARVGRGVRPQVASFPGCGKGAAGSGRTVPRGSGRSSWVRMWFRAGEVGEGFSSAASRGSLAAPAHLVLGAGWRVPEGRGWGLRTGGDNAWALGESPPGYVGQLAS